MPKVSWSTAVPKDGIIAWGQIGRNASIYLLRCRLFWARFYIRVKRSDVPRYGVLFTCMTSRAIHLEMAESLDTDAFINALRRFIAIRGPIRHLRSDRGTNFVGAKNVLDKELAAINQTKVKDFLLHQNCDYFDFKMNFPHSSHMGGVWERQIRTVRGVLQPLLDKVRNSAQRRFPSHPILRSDGNRE